MITIGDYQRGNVTDDRVYTIRVCVNRNCFGCKLIGSWLMVEVMKMINRRLNAGFVDSIIIVKCKI